MDPLAPRHVLPSGEPRSAASAPRPATDAELRKSAEDFETAFLAEMLKYSGINEVSSDFGGGEGEEAFASMLTDEYARIIAEAGGIGLAEQIFESMKQRTSDQ